MTSYEIKNAINKSYCSVPQCYTEGTKNPSVSFHRFPVDIKQRLKWKYAARIGKQISNRMCVCSRHFKTNDYFYNGINVKRKRLKKIAVPSLNLPTTQVQENIPDILNAKGRNMLSNARNQVINQKKVTTEGDFSRSFKEIERETSKTKPDIVYLSVCMNKSCDQNSNQIEQCSESIGISFENKDLYISEKTTESTNNLDVNERIGCDLPGVEDGSDHYSSIDSVSLDAEILKQRLEEMTTRYLEAQKEIQSYQDRCKKYEKQITSLEKVIDNFNEITSDDS